MATHIQIGDVSPRVQYVADGVQTVFTYPFPIFEDADLEVYLDDTLTSAGFTIVGAGDSEGGSVTFDTAPSASVIVTLARRMAVKRTSDFLESGELRAKVLNDELDHLTAYIQQVEDDNTRALQISITEPTQVDMSLPTPTGDAVLVWNTDGDGFANGPSVTEVSNAQTYSQNASAAADAASLSETNAATSATNAATSEANAATSATAAQAAANSVIYNDVIYLTTASSPYALSASQNGVLLSVDASAGAIAINLPAVSTAGDGFVVSVKKTDSSGNAITVNADGSDTIDGGGSVVVSTVNSGTTLVADTDATPDEWTSVAFGTVGGNLTSDHFASGVDYTKNVSTQVTLSIAPGSESNMWVFFDGVFQPESTFTLSGSTVTFGSAIPSDSIDVLSGATLAIGVPADATVTTTKIVDANVTPAKLSADARASDIPFNAGFDATMSLSNLAVQSYGELVMSRPGTFVGEAGYIDAASTGSAVIVDIEKNGASIYVTPPHFAAASNTLTAGTLKTDGSEDYVSGDRISFKITQVGSGSTGQGVRFTAKGELS